MKFLVIGGSGFVGQHLVELLLQHDNIVVVFDLHRGKNENVKYVTGDLTNKELLMEAMMDIDLVFHCASPAPHLDNRDLFYKVNVDGTKNVVDCCKESKIQHLVLTGSASVTYEGKDITGGLETAPYAAQPIDYYTETKILQEKIVRAANSSDFHTVVIRPHGIFGPRDRQMIPTTVLAAREGKMKFIIGNGQNLVDFTFVENVAYGHLLAANRLMIADSNVYGKAYHITNDEPIQFWMFIRQILSHFKYSKPTTTLNANVAYYYTVIICFFINLIRFIFGDRLIKKPTLSPSRVLLATTHHWYDIEAAKRDLGYAPIVSLGEGLHKSLVTYPELMNPNV
ncbi:hypothetical protein SNEBB_000722 [Seison nebaliae]|nr:hypothetical protein SNEBB_000722 [Seison nebaliae]